MLVGASVDFGLNRFEFWLWGLLDMPRRSMWVVALGYLWLNRFEFWLWGLLDMQRRSMWVVALGDLWLNLVVC
jgi:hypothetical protein